MHGSWLLILLERAEKPILQAFVQSDKNVCDAAHLHGGGVLTVLRQEGILLEGSKVWQAVGLAAARIAV